MDTVPTSVVEASLLGIGAGDWLQALLTAASLLVAIITAAIISPKLAERSARRDQRERLLRVLISTSPLPANPDYQGAIGLIPIDFKGCERVLKARSDYLAFVRTPFPEDDSGRAAHLQESINLQADMIAAMGQELGFDLTRQSLIDGAYVSQGFVEREELNIAAARSWLRIATALEMNNEMFARTLSQTGNDASGAPTR
ncbi:hypothetical protein GRI75_06465 [Altererythrobacter soli]|uniref:DUF6680 domain-containing protein n=1 Tax=Croceibacterium soli TaxID=1739690 RepID=A0A6I4UQX4_9SPHN|nr:DUF6680 family protein [Croceibacterium soli]MXP41282.1 hypothetical protein [Croceibacterium soli]